MPDQETWRFINSFAPWLSGLGTLAAVIFSLWLARRSARADIRVTCAIVNLMVHGQRLKESASFLQIQAVNHGTREVKIKGIMWALGGVRHQKFVVIPPADPYSTKLPAKLEHGDDASFFFPIASFQKDARALLDRIKQARFESLALRGLRVGVYASTGEEFLARPRKAVRDWIAEQLKQASA